MGSVIHRFRRRAVGLAVVGVVVMGGSGVLPPRGVAEAGSVGPSDTEQVAVQSFYAAPQYRWTQVNRSLPDRSYWDDLDEGARAGWSTRPRGVFRSLFQMALGPIAGTRVHNVYFTIMLDRSNFCRTAPVELWHTRSIDPAVPLTWNNSHDHWLGDAPLVSGSAQACDDFDAGMEFASGALHELVQRAADEHAPSLTLGLRVPEERDPRQGMLFHPDTAALVVEYNSPPDAPSRLSTVPPTPCASGDVPVLVTAGRAKRFSAVATDPDRDNINTLLEIVDIHGTVVHSVESSTTTSGSAFSWSEIPEGVLHHSETYAYRARSQDSLDTGPYTASCYFTIDAVRPGVPRIESADYPPDGEPAIPARTTGTVTLRPADSDTDVTEYRFGLQQLRITRRVKAGPEGTAVVPITVDARFGEWLYVVAVDRAGNHSPTAPTWDLNVLRNPAPQTHEPGDTSGDGRADVTAVLDHGFGTTMVWNVVARDGGFHAAVVGFENNYGSFFEPDRPRFVRGDFDGDGRTDLAEMRNDPNGRAWLSLLRSDGNGYAGFAAWDSGSEAWPLATTRMVAGDFDGNGRADVAVQRARDGGGWQVMVFRGGALATPVSWYETAGGDQSRSRIVAGDFDGDGRADLAELRDEGDCNASLLVHRSTGTAFEDGVLTWDSGPGGFCADRASLVSGDVHGDGRDDIVARYEHDRGTGLLVFDAAGSPTEWWHDEEFDPGTAVLSMGDFDLDGRADLAVVSTGATERMTEAWTLRSTGSTFTDPVLGWRETTGGIPYGP